MKVCMIVSAFLLCSLIASAQRYDTTNMSKRMALAGSELLKFRSNYNTGIVITLIGAAAAIGGSAADSKNNGPIIGIGAGFVALGTIFIIAAHSHIGKAGVYLKGNSLIVPFK